MGSSGVPFTVFLPVVFGIAFALYYVLVLKKKNAGVMAAYKAGLGGVEVAEAKKSAKRGDAGPLRALLADCRARGAYDDLGFICDLVARSLPPPALKMWCDKEPQSADAFLAQGYFHIEWAWTARGHGDASTVSKEGHALFRQRLQTAESHFQQAAQLDPRDPNPYAAMITLANGLQYPIGHCQQLFDQAQRRDPAHWAAHASMLTRLTEKWGGSHEQMFDFARRVAQSASGATVVLKAILLKAHIERWLYSASFENDSAAAKHYVKNPQVQTEAAAAYDAILAAPPENRSAIYAHNTAGMWFYLAKDKPRCRHAIGLIANAYSEVPWCYLDDPQMALHKATTWAYRPF